MKVHFQALGCRLNEAELESWSNDVVQRGHRLTTNSQDADVVVFNSCSVTAKADRKSRKLINRIHKNNPDAHLIVTGCYASLQADSVRQQTGVDRVVTNQHKEILVDAILQPVKSFQPDADTLEKQSLFVRGRQRAFIKIQDGCRYRCSFCIVTLARGDERSRSQKEIIDEIRRYHQQGIQEVVITGVHVGGYGSDTGSDLYELLSEILDKTDIPRIRLASVEPWDLGSNFFQLFADKRLMPHMHLPLQSGSNSVLRRMSRRCKTTDYEALVDSARSAIPGFNVTTDLIVGFPGESQQEWNDTVRFVEKTGFGHMHIFTYSRREGTRAAAMPDQIGSRIKKQRSAQMHEIAQNLKQKAMSKFIGKSCDVLWENCVDESRGMWAGYTPQYHKVHAYRAHCDLSQIGAVTIDALAPSKNNLLGSTTSWHASCCSSQVEVS